MIRHNTGLWLHEGEQAWQDTEVVLDVYLGDEYFTHLMPSGRTVVDIGAHIGTFALKWRAKAPEAQICCVEACPENLLVLRANVGHFADVVHAACTYEPGPVRLLNSIQAGGVATGGSMVIPASGRPATAPNLRGAASRYWEDDRPLASVTLEDLMVRLGVRFIDVLKLDCEGSEFSILENTPSLRSIGFICGEYHGRAQWERLVAERFCDWEYGHMFTSGELGIFHLRNRRPVKQLVLANGCFDLLGPHHINFLERAKALGDFLLVAVNSDESVRRLKGDNRPVYPLAQRLAMLRALRFVDEVKPFDSEEELAALIARERPAVLAKGADYAGRTLTGAEAASRIELLPLTSGSTTSTIERMHAG